MYIDLFMSQTRNEYSIETKAKLIFSSVRKDSFLPPPEFPHKVDNGLFCVFKAFGKILTTTHVASELRNQRVSYEFFSRNIELAQKIRREKKKKKKG